MCNYFICFNSNKDDVDIFQMRADQKYFLKMMIILQKGSPRSKYTKFMMVNRKKGEELDEMSMRFKFSNIKCDIIKLVIKND